MEPKKQEDAEKKLQAKYMEFQSIEQQMRQLDNNLQTLDGQLMEIKSMQQSIKEMESIKKNSEIMVPVAAGMFVKGTITDSNIILVNVGNNVLVDKTIPQAVELLEKQIGEMSGIRAQIIAQLNKMSAKMQTLDNELQKLVQG